jgi:Malectin domain
VCDLARQRRHLLSYTALIDFACALQVFVAPNQRVFNVFVESPAPVINGLDVVKMAGVATAYVAEATASVVDGFVTIQLEAVVDYPMISAIEVILIPEPIA